MALVDEGPTRAHLMRATTTRAGRRLSVCGLYHTYAEVRNGTTEDVTCGRCKRTALFVVERREEERI